MDGNGLDLPFQGLATCPPQLLGLIALNCFPGAMLQVRYTSNPYRSLIDVSRNRIEGAGLVALSPGQ